MRKALLLLALPPACSPAEAVPDRWVRAARHTDGSPFFKAVYLDAWPDGPFTAWHPNGALFLDGVCRNGATQPGARAWAPEGLPLGEDYARSAAADIICGHPYLGPRR